MPHSWHPDRKFGILPELKQLASSTSVRNITQHVKCIIITQTREGRTDADCPVGSNLHDLASEVYSVMICHVTTMNYFVSTATDRRRDLEEKRSESGSES
ncbi:uncharacterized [Tachysurus ichikawai]